MKRPLIMAAAVSVAAAAAFWQSAPPQALASLFPAGPLLYIEARDFAGLLADWNASAEKKLWLTSDNYQVFSRTRLFLRLADAHAEYAEAAGFAADLPFVQSLAGTQSALAIYDIGALHFLYISRISAPSPVLTKAGSAYETRSAAGHSYYVRTGSGGRTAAFAHVNGNLILATREDLIANALKLIAGQREAAVPSEAWYAPTLQTAGDLRIMLNMRRLLDSPYFRSYWIQRNASTLRPYTAGVIDLFREADRYREERVLIRETPAAATDGAAVAQVLAWAPDDVGIRRAWANPQPADIVELVRSKILSPGRSTNADRKDAPLALSPDVTLGTVADLETRIDQPPLQSQQQADELEPLQRLNPSAVLHVQRSRTAADGVYIGNESAIGILGTANWPELSVTGAHIHRQGRTLVISSSPELLAEVVAKLNSKPAANAAAYSATYFHSRESEPFARMMGFIDTSKGGSGEPSFFSGNVASFGRVLSRVRSVDVAVRDTGSQLRQQVVYNFR